MKKQRVGTVVHFGAMAFEEICGEVVQLSVAFVLENDRMANP